MFRSHNFSAGPAVLPLEVLETAQKELLNYKGKGSSIIEMSHRSPEYSEVDEQARQRLKKIMGLGDDYEVLFQQGGASTQFHRVPQNYLSADNTADYINTGSWSKKAIKEAKLFGNVNVAFTSEEDNFNRLPDDSELNLSSSAEYVHFTSNNTIFGTQFTKEPETGGVPLVCDASSDFLSRPIDVEKYGLIYAGAQKNAGPAGVTIVVIRKDFLEKAQDFGLPNMSSYKVQADNKVYNTPPVFAVYFFNLILGWLEQQGGLEGIQKRNREKADLLYQEIDRDDFYHGTARKDCRSDMNVTFRLPSEDLEKKFLSEAEEHHLHGLKGHRSVGGMRASIYNACPPESVKALVEFMQDFRKRNG